MTAIEIFAWGFAGSIAVDIVTVAQLFNAPKVSLPDRYTHLGFYLVRLLLACVAGGLAIAYEIDKALLAANIGAATPLIVTAFAQGVGNIPAVSSADATTTHSSPRPNS